MNGFAGFGLGAMMLAAVAGSGHLTNAAGNRPDMDGQKFSVTTEKDAVTREKNGSAAYKTDGKNRMTQTENDSKHPKTDIEWWSYDEYAQWIKEEKKRLTSLIGTGDGWYDAEGKLHKWTEESVKEQIAGYEKTLKDIKNGMLYSKDNGDGVTYSMTVPDKNKLGVDFSIEIIEENGESINLGK